MCTFLDAKADDNEEIVQVYLGDFKSQDVSLWALLQKHITKDCDFQGWLWHFGNMCNQKKNNSYTPMI